MSECLDCGLEWSDFNHIPDDRCYRRKYGADIQAKDAEIAKLKAELAKCGKENCMGHEVDGCASWVRKERLEQAEAEREAWKKTAEQHCRNEDFYRGLVSGIGAQFGEVAYISEDGSKQQDVLCLKVPELVHDLRDRCLRYREALENVLGLPLSCCDGGCPVCEGFDDIVKQAKAALAEKTEGI